MSAAWTAGYEVGKNEGITSGWTNAITAVATFLKQQDESLLAAEVVNLFIDPKGDLA